MSESWKAALHVMVAFICLATIFLVVISFWYWLAKVVVQLIFGG